MPIEHHVANLLVTFAGGVNLRRNIMTDQYNQETLLQLADNMAACATVFCAHGYDQFIQARDTFKDALAAAFASAKASSESNGQ